MYIKSLKVGVKRKIVELMKKCCWLILFDEVEH
ncbi:hypothetical protein BDFB_010764 [Asbolus verrucosus]|uniref:Uncharacterized protein n=1 Tax=Asbolus verrucosus TaxID=1661398 RepID=A0A482W7A0_ASBVE|nr:hypothetical protein BDFB_010764 [Asbolus verrucosus]